MTSLAATPSVTLSFTYVTYGITSCYIPHPDPCLIPHPEPGWSHHHARTWVSTACLGQHWLPAAGPALPAPPAAAGMVPQMLVSVVASAACWALARGLHPVAWAWAVPLVVAGRGCWRRRGATATPAAGAGAAEPAAAAACQATMMLAGAGAETPAAVALPQRAAGCCCGAATWPSC